MTIEATSFNIGESPSVRLDLLSSDGLAPLPLPMPSEGQAERFCRFMGGDGERPMDIGRGLSALSSAVEATMVEVHVDATPAGESGQAVRRETIDAPQAPHMMPEDSGFTVPGPRSVPVPEPAVATNEAVPRVVETPVAETPAGESGQAVRRETVRRETIDAPQAPHMMPEDSSFTVPGPRSVPVLEQSVVTNEAVPRVVETPVAETPAGESGQAVRRETVDVPQAPHMMPEDSGLTVPGPRSVPVLEQSVATNEAVPRVVDAPVAETPAGESGQAVPRVVDAPVAETPAGESGQVVRRETVDAPQAPHMMPEGAGIVAFGPRSVPVLEQSVATNEAVPRVVETPVAETPAGESGQAVRRETVDAPQDSRFTPKGIRLSPGVSRSAAAPEAVVLQAAPAGVPVPAGVEAPVVPEAVQHVAAATARTEVIVETVNRMVETIVDRISVTPSFAGGEGEMCITLRPTVLDGSAINLSAKDGELSVAVVPATPQAAAVAAAALPRLESALAAHAPAFHHVAVVLASVRKGKTNEAA